MEETLDALQKRYELGSSEPQEFEIAELDANAYLRERAAVELPAGVESPWVRFEESVAVVGATVDLDQMRGSLPDSMVFRLLSGRVPVEVTARLQAEKGTGKLDIERVLLAGIELPPSLVAHMANGSGAEPYLPPGFKLGEPFALPLDLESIHCRVGLVRLRQGRSANPK
jgi:hypothetical protein